MCNLHTQTRSQEAMRQLFADRGWLDRVENVEPDDVFPARMAPIIRAEGDDLVLKKARWGLPSPPQYYSKSGIDHGVANVRNTGSPHWRSWSGLPIGALCPSTASRNPAQADAAPATPGSP